jgi:hypothetical protein
MTRKATKPSVWTCMECGATGEAPVKAMAVAAFTEHWGQSHNNVPWLEGEA